MSRIESGKMLLKNEKIPTEEFLVGINSICYGQAEAKGVEYECIVDPVLDDYYIGDAMKLQQVLINILNNAIKFTGEGGKVTFSASQRRKTKNDAMLRFIVNDTGVGTVSYTHLLIRMMTRAISLKSEEMLRMEPSRKSST